MLALRLSIDKTNGNSVRGMIDLLSCSVLPITIVPVGVVNALVTNSWLFIRIMLILQVVRLWI
jgi:hypothetical protein